MVTIIMLFRYSYFFINRHINSLMSNLARRLLILMCTVVLTGCGLELPFIIAAAGIGVGAAVVIDRRAATTQANDLKIETRANSYFRTNYSEKDAHVNVSSFNHVVLLTGEAVNNNIRQNIVLAVGSISNVRQVINKIVLAPVSSVSDRANDTWITTKVKASFATDRAINGRDIQVVTEATVVYLMGIVTPDESMRARDYASSGIAGVTKVVTIFEIANSATVK